MGWMATLKDLLGVAKTVQVANTAVETEAESKANIVRQSGSVLPILSFLREFFEQSFTYPWDRVPLWKMKLMWKEDACRNACDFLTYLVMKRIGVYNYQHEDPEIEQLVKDAIENMDSSFYSHMRDLLCKGLFFGFSAIQLVFDVKDNNYLFGWMVNYNSEDLEFKVAKNDRNKEFISGLKVNNTSAQEFSSKNFIIYQYGELSSPYGFGRGNYLEIYYDLKLLCLKLWAIFMQKFTIPTILAESSNDLTGLMNQCTQWLYNNVLGIVKDEDQVTLVEKKADVERTFQDCIEFCDKVIYRIFFMLALLSGGEKGGSYALGDKHFDLLVEVAEEIGMDFADNVIISQIIVKLIEYNKGPQKDYGKFKSIQPLSIEDKSKMAAIFATLVNTGVLSEEDSDWMRKDMDFPEKEEVIPSIEETLTQTQEIMENENVTNTPAEATGGIPA